VCRLHEQAVELAGALLRLEQHGEADDLRAQLGDADEPGLDLVDRELDRIGMSDELFAALLGVQRLTSRL
jgi:hypothetical protein